MKEKTVGAELVEAAKAQLAKEDEQAQDLQELLDRMTERQRRFVWAYAETGKGAESVRRAGYNTKRSEQQAVDNLSKPYIRQALKIILSSRYGESFVRCRFAQLSLKAESEQVQLGATDRLAKIAGLYDKKEQQNTGEQHLHIHLPPSRSKKSH